MSAVFNSMPKQALDCRNMVRVKVWHTHTTVWLLKNYSQRILTYYTRILLLDLTYGRTMVLKSGSQELRRFTLQTKSEWFGSYLIVVRGHEILYTKCFLSTRLTTFGVFFLWLSLLCLIIGCFWYVIEPKIRHSCLACPFSICAYSQVKYWGTCPLTAIVDACALWCHNHYFMRAYVRVCL